VAGKAWTSFKLNGFLTSGRTTLTDYVVKSDNAAEFWTDERCYITELCNTGYAPDGSLAIARVEPGVTTQLHSLTGLTETYIVIEGSGLMEVDGNQFNITVGDQVVIPSGIPQRVTALGESDLRFYCLCTPRFFPDSYINLE
jgi:mannose-6-phosphate isomerase-like protein (cupin superfamily)